MIINNNAFTSKNFSIQSTKFWWMINISIFDILEAFYFENINVIDFLNRYEDFCYDFHFNEIEKMRRLFRYCEMIINQFIEIIEHWIVKNWIQLRKILLKKYKFNDIIQKMHFRKFLKIYKNKTRFDQNDICQYCRRFLTVNNNLIEKNKLNEIIRIT